MNAHPRTAIVTGAATTKRLSRDGFAVGVLDLDAAAGTATVDEIESAGGNAIAVGADVAAVAFMVSDDASFVSGQVVYVAVGPR